MIFKNNLVVVDLDDREMLADIEVAVIRATIAHTAGNMSEVARRLGIGRSTLYRKLQIAAIKEAP